MNHIGLFEGIGGFSLAAEWMEWDTIAWCEINPFCKKILSYHFPKAIGHDDITTTDFSIYRGSCDIVTAGFPCQPFSQAGKRKGTEDDRHLWSSCIRAIREIQPRWVVGENVLGLLNWSRGLVFHQVQTDLEAAGYIIFPYVLPACAKNAPHRRDRTWIVAYAKGERGKSTGRIYKRTNQEGNRQRFRDELNHDSGARITTNTEGNGINREEKFENGNRQSGKRGRCDTHDTCQVRQGNGNEDATNTENSEFRNNGCNGNDSHSKCKGLEGGGWQRQRFEQGLQVNDWTDWPTQSPLCSRDDGLSPELAGITVSKHRTESIKGYGNSIVPQIAFEIFKAIEKYEHRI